MAKYRYVYCEFWTDSDVLEFTPEEKYFYVYILTNPHTTQCGIFEISIKQMEFETGYNRDTIVKLIDRFQYTYKKIKYNYDTKEMAIKNWPNYNLTSSPKVKACINSELKSIHDDSLIDYLYSDKDKNSFGLVEIDLKIDRRQIIWIRDKGICQYCGTVITNENDYEMDHVIPLSRSGKDRYDNIVCACKLCNQKKVDMLIEEIGYKNVYPESFHRNSAYAKLTEDEELLNLFNLTFNRNITNENGILNDVYPKHQNGLPYHKEKEKEKEKENIKEKEKLKIKEISYGEIYNSFTSSGFGPISPLIKDMIDDDIEKYSAEWVYEAIKEAVSRNVRNLKYVESILQNWINKGGIHTKSEKVNKNGNDSNTDKSEYIEPENKLDIDEL